MNTKLTGNEDYDLPFWKREASKWIHSPSPFILLDGALTLAAIEILRDNVRELEESVGVKTHTLAFNYGDNDDPFSTKIGGSCNIIPSNELCITIDGEHYIYTAQFDLSLLRDPSLPGDMALLYTGIFRDRLNKVSLLLDTHPSENKFFLRWLKKDACATYNNNYSAKKDAPTIPPLTGVFHNSFDYNIDGTNFKAMLNHVESIGLNNRVYNPDYLIKAVLIHFRNKIGGIPRSHAKKEPDDTYLFTFCGFNYMHDQPYPWCNRINPPPVSDYLTPLYRLPTFEDATYDFYWSKPQGVYWKYNI